MTVIRLEEERYEIAVPRDKAAGFMEALEAGAERSGASWDLLDIRAGIPVITAATQEAFVPQMVNLDVLGGVSFEKGCYPGQEIVARMHYRGTLKQRMYLAHVEGTEQPQPGDKLYSPAFGEQSSGTIVNAAAAPDGGSDVLAVVQIAAGGTNSEVHWKNPAGPRLTFRTLPYSVS